MYFFKFYNFFIVYRVIEGDFFYIFFLMFGLMDVKEILIKIKF